MLREAITMLVAFSVTLFSLAPGVEAQSGWPTVSQSDSASQPTQYPQPPQYPPPTQYPQAAGNGSYPASEPNPESTPQQDEAADQQHGIARLSIVQGDVNVRRGDSGELTAAVINAPLAAQDHLQTAAGSRAEVELDNANVVRLAPDSELGFADLEYRRYQLQLGTGAIIYRVLRNSSSQVEIDTPSIGFRPAGEGEFRVSVLPDGTTQITARSGQGEIFGPRGSQQLPAGQTILVRGNPSDPEFRTAYASAPDQFDQWSAQRDSELLRSQSYRYVSSDIPGADDLDQYGNWVPSQYGQVWAPQSEPADWSPYSTGQWAWQDYYGWTWVDSAPWGWAPYHYGRWFHNAGYGWCWWPGAIHSSYFWNPALVGFFGWGGFGAGLALGGLGWVALAPFETFHRWWGPGWYGRGWGGLGYGGRGSFRPYNNFVRGGDIGRMYRNAAYRGGAMTAGYNGFGGPHQRFAAATRGQLSNASSFRGGRMPMTPTRASYQFSNRQVTANPRLASAANQRFFESSQFRNQQGSLRGQQNSFRNQQNLQVRGQQSNPAAGRSLSSPPNRYGTGAGSSNYGRSSANGWQRFGDPGNGGALREGFRGGSDMGGWHSFGQPQPSNTQRSSSPAYSNPQPRGQRYSGSQYATPHYTAPSSSSSPRYNAPQSYRSAPRYNAPQSAPRYSASPSYNSAPRYNSPSYSAPQHYGSPNPRTSSPAPHYNSAPARSNGGGGSFHSSGGGGGGSHGGGGGSHGGGGGHHR